MGLKSFEELRRDLKNKIYYPVYLLQGEEPYYIDQLSHLIENGVLDEMEKEFNQTILYGKDCDPMQLVSAAKRFPMMSNYQVIIVKEAQEIKAFFPKAKNKEDDKKEEKENAGPLANYLANPQPSTLLVLCVKYKSIDKRGKIYKAIEKNGVVFEMKKLYDDKLPKWIEDYLADKKMKISPNASLLMAEHLGNDLSRIANECDKLLINIKAGEKIDLKHIEQFIGVSKEFNIFELLKALGRKDVLKSNKIANYFKANPKSCPMPLTMANLYNFFSKTLLYHSLTDKSRNNVATALKIHSFHLDDYFSCAKNYSPDKIVHVFSVLREYDLRSKGLGGSNPGDGDLVREMVYKILH